jgi:hypothetical protein
MFVNGGPMLYRLDAPLPRQRRSASAGSWWCSAMVRGDLRGYEMTKSKGRASAKARSGTKHLSKVKRANPPVVHHKTLTGSKQEAVLAPLSRPSGATIAAIMEATGWRAHYGARLSGRGGSEETRPSIIDFIRAP